eukprot:gnl/MRDRNA2_/MRDRNA2_108478_c0_seq1.p1 gnl/MRDRNA2_/MRDRNA2_108478_c0~~gnl/MRDRNA2_/MRDRNA2_108478_c0_seq1.p1  ORF type:complete len:645 (-),score=153.78 gnl/MRDRNA2_/MRDRNA2_108478_c0_seq1:88-2022(-)
MASRLSPQAQCRYRSPGPMRDPVQCMSQQGLSQQCMSPQAAHRQTIPQPWGGVPGAPLQRVNSYEPCRVGSPTPTTARSSVPSLLPPQSPQQQSRQVPPGQGDLTARPPHWPRNEMGGPQSGMAQRVPSNANLRGPPQLAAPSAGCPQNSMLPQQSRMSQMPQGPGVPPKRMPDDEMQLDRIFVDTANLARVREEAEAHRHRAEQLQQHETQLLAELESERRMCKSATQRAEHIETMLRSEKENLVNQQEENHRLRDDAQKAKTKVQHMEKEYAEQNSKMEMYLDQIMGENGRKEKEISHLQQTHVETCADLRNRLETLNTEVRELQNEKSTLALRYRSLEAQLDDYRRKYKDAEQRCKQYEERVPELEHHYRASQDEISKFHSTLEQRERKCAKAVEQKEAQLQSKETELQAKLAEIQSYRDRESQQREREAQQVAVQEAEWGQVKDLLLDFTRAVESASSTDNLRDALGRLSAAQLSGRAAHLGKPISALCNALSALLAQISRRESDLIHRTKELQYESQVAENRAKQKASQEPSRRERELEAVLREREREDAEKSQQQSICEMEINKENMRLQEVVHHQGGLITQLEGQLKLENDASKILVPAQAERILRLQEEHLLSENQSLHMEVAVLKRQVSVLSYNR